MTMMRVMMMSFKKYPQTRLWGMCPGHQSGVGELGKERHLDLIKHFHNLTISQEGRSGFRKLSL